MPNWCSNNITIFHDDPKMLDRIEKSETKLFSEFIPTPKELEDTPAGYFADVAEQEKLNLRIEENIAKYGASDWYDWNVKNWGTKWDVELQGIDRVDPNTIIASFESAWSPPIEAYKKLEKLGFVIDATYYEPGLGFCGQYVNGYDTCFDDLESYDSTTVREYIGEELDEQFGISLDMADTEQARLDDLYDE